MGIWARPALQGWKDVRMGVRHPVAGLGHFFATFEVITLLASLVGDYLVFQEVVANRVARRMPMELSMTIAVTANLAIGEFFTAVVIILFVLVAEVLVGLTEDRGWGAIKDLRDLRPLNVEIRRQGDRRQSPLARSRWVTWFLASPALLVPWTGLWSEELLCGSPLITGEILPVEKLPSNQVYAGTINQSVVIDVQTERIR